MMITAITRPTSANPFGPDSFLAIARAMKHIQRDEV